MERRKVGFPAFFLHFYYHIDLYTLLLDMRLIHVGGAQENEGQFDHKNFLRALK